MAKRIGVASGSFSNAGKTVFFSIFGQQIRLTLPYGKVNREEIAEELEAMAGCCTAAATELLEKKVVINNDKRTGINSCTIFLKQV